MALTGCEMWFLLLPGPVDELLFAIPEGGQEIPQTIDCAVTICRYSCETIPPAYSAMARLSPERLLYVVTHNDTGEFIGSSTVFFDALLPARFGHGASIPVVGDCRIDEVYGGRRI
jgi:hypothetical protein